MRDYDYLVKEDGSIKTIENSQDVYVQLLVDEKQYYVPVSMPRRNPKLRFDLSQKNDELWDYLDQCKKELSPNKVDLWKKEQLKKLGHAISKDDLILKGLLENDTVCCSCFSKNIKYLPNPQKNIQNLRDRGFVIITIRSAKCSVCNDKKAKYILTPNFTTDVISFENISKALKKRICTVFDFRDAYTGIYNPSIAAYIPDHKFPEDRWDGDTAIQNSDTMSDEEIRNKFQLLNPQTNMQKQRFCGECIRTGKRGYPFGIKYFYKGDENWDSNIPTTGKDAEKGCVGCGWYDLLKWKEKLNKKINGED